MKKIVCLLTAKKVIIQWNFARQTLCTTVFPHLSHPALTPLTDIYTLFAAYFECIYASMEVIVSMYSESYLFI